MSSAIEVPQLETLSRDDFRRRLAGLGDPQEKQPIGFRSDADKLSVEFCTALPAVFGQELDRMTLWGKIASAIQSAYAKTAGGDVGFFTQQVLESIKADPAQAVACEKLLDAMDSLNSLDETKAKEWMAYLTTHLIPVLAKARKMHKESIN